MGIESVDDVFYITVPERITPADVVHGFNAHLPDGLAVHDCRPAPIRSSRKKAASVSYHVILKDGFFDPKALICFHNSTHAVITRTSPKGKTRTVDLKQILSGIDLLAPDTLRISLDSASGTVVRPLEVVSAVFNIDDLALKQAHIVKQGNDIYTAAHNDVPNP